MDYIQALESVATHVAGAADQSISKFQEYFKRWRGVSSVPNERTADLMAVLNVLWSRAEKRRTAPEASVPRSKR